jgi:hypothetical protein
MSHGVVVSLVTAIQLRNRLRRGKIVLRCTYHNELRTVSHHFLASSQVSAYQYCYDIMRLLLVFQKDRSPIAWFWFSKRSLTTAGLLLFGFQKGRSL